MLFICRLTLAPFPFNNTIPILIFHHELILPFQNHSLLLCSDFPPYPFIILEKDVSRGINSVFHKGRKQYIQKLMNVFQPHLIDQTSFYISWVIPDIVNSYASCCFLSLSPCCILWHHCWMFFSFPSYSRALHLIYAFLSCARLLPWPHCF